MKTRPASASSFALRIQEPRRRCAVLRRAALRCAVPLVAALLFAFGTGCGHVAPKTPDGFVELDEESVYTYRATTADGVVFALRDLEHEPKGDLAFWTRAIENEMRGRGGYALLGKKTVKTARGLDGRELRFGHDEGSVPHLYVVTLFVTESRIYLLEAGGPKDLLTEKEKSLADSIAHFDPK